ncbi:alpha/beta-hydrolase [Hypoxylon fuscum]|nr:alpha/beta-hydrolase [Hypoxylon fuscum]
MNSPVFLPLAFLVKPFASFTSAFGPNGISNPVSGPSTGGGSTCISGDITLSINTPGIKLRYEAPQDQMAVTESFVELFQVDSIFGADVTEGGPSVISGDYGIFVKLCLPSDPEVFSYSYVDVASAAGYATLSYDQLGVGNSDHPDPIQAVQATAQVAVTHALVGLLRNAELGGYRFDKVVGVGHSAGSTLTQGITTQFPQDFNAVILSGSSTSAASVPLTMAAFNLINANTDPAPQFQHLPAGFLTQQSAAGIQFAFYRQPNFDENAFRQQVAHKQANTLGVLLTLGGIC